MRMHATDKLERAPGRKLLDAALAFALVFGVAMFLGLGLAPGLTADAKAAEGCQKYADDMRDGGLIPKSRHYTFVYRCRSRADIAWYNQCLNACESNTAGEAKDGCTKSCMMARALMDGY